MALAKPRAGFGGTELYTTMAAKAAALLYVFSKSQACYDGNKRLALLVVVAFIRANGLTLNVQRHELADMILAVAETDQQDHDVVIEQTAVWLAARLPEEEP